MKSGPSTESSVPPSPVPVPVATVAADRAAGFLAEDAEDVVVEAPPQASTPQPTALPRTAAAPSTGTEQWYDGWTDSSEGTRDPNDNVMGGLGNRFKDPTGWFVGDASPLVSLRELASELLASPPPPLIGVADGGSPAEGVEEHPAGPERAMAIVSELKSSAALFAAFAFGALNLPGTLIISESRITSASSSVSTSRPVPESDLLQAFVVLDVATFGFMLICVVVSQQLLYRLGDGSYGSVRFGTPERPDPRDSALGRLATQYGLEFSTARLAFGLGVAAILLATVVKTWAVFDSSIALPVTAVIGLSSVAILAFYTRVNDTFRQLDEEWAADPWRKAAKGALVAAGIAILFSTFTTLTSMDRASGVTAERAFQRVVSAMEKAAAEKADAEKAVAETVAAERAAEVRVVEAKAVVEQAVAERAAAEAVAVEKRAAAAQAVSVAQAEKAAAEKAAAEIASALERTAKSAAVKEVAFEALGADRAAAAATTAERSVAERVAAQRAAVAEKAAVEKAVAVKVAASARAAVAEKAAIEEAAAAENVDEKKAAVDAAQQVRLSAERTIKRATEAAAVADVAEAEQTAAAQAAANAAVAEKLALERVGSAEAEIAKVEVQKVEAERAASRKSEAADQAARVAAASQTVADAATAESLAAEKALAQKAVAERVAVEREAAAEKAAKKASAARSAALKVASEKSEAEKAAGVPMRAAADRAEAENLALNLSRGRAEAERLLSLPQAEAENLAENLSRGRDEAEKLLSLNRAEAEENLADNLSRGRAEAERLLSLRIKP